MDITRENINRLSYILEREEKSTSTKNEKNEKFNGEKEEEKGNDEKMNDNNNNSHNDNNNNHNDNNNQSTNNTHTQANSNTELSSSSQHCMNVSCYLSLPFFPSVFDALPCLEFDFRTLLPSLRRRTLKNFQTFDLCVRKKLGKGAWKTVYECEYKEKEENNNESTNNKNNEKSTKSNNETKYNEGKSTKIQQGEQVEEKSLKYTQKAAQKSNFFADNLSSLSSYSFRRHLPVTLPTLEESTRKKQQQQIKDQVMSVLTFDVCVLDDFSVLSLLLMFCCAWINGFSTEFHCVCVCMCVCVCVCACVLCRHYNNQKQRRKRKRKKKGERSNFWKKQRKLEVQVILLYF